MRRALRPHPDFPCAALSSIEVEVRRDGSALELRYHVAGRIDDVLLPAPAEPARRDGLWKHSCFEAFLRPAAAAPYLELNFAPSGEWAAYDFDDHRVGMRDADIPPPSIEARRHEGGFALAAAVEGLPEGPWQLGLSAVIEETSGARSFWALAHPPGKPDFHHPDSFALELPVTRKP